MTGVAEFVGELAALGRAARTPEADFVVVDYEPELGPLAGSTVEVGFRVLNFPVEPPSGLLVRPHLMPIGAPGSEHPYGGVHPSAVGGVTDGSFQYWSRPFPGWHTSDHTVRTYLDDHVRTLFATLPPDLGGPK